MSKKLDLELEAISKTKDYENMSDNMIIHIVFFRYSYLED